MQERIGKLQKYAIISVFLAVVVAGGLFFSRSVDSANEPRELFGYAWGAIAANGAPQTGLGWLSFRNPNEGHPNSNINYGVIMGVPDGNGNRVLTGHAWSSNYGWVQFGGLGGFPSGPGTISSNAYVDQNGSVHGWARFCSAVYANGCSGSAQSVLKHGGWDGWLSLRGSSYGVSLIENRFTGFAWAGGTDGSGSALIAGPGWVAFDNNGDCSLFCVEVEDDEASVVLRANGQTEQIFVNAGTPFTLSWVVEGMSTAQCQGSGGSWLQSYPWPQQSSQSHSEIVNGTYIYLISCNDGNTTVEDTVQVVVGDGIRLIANPVQVSWPATTTRLRWFPLPEGQPTELFDCIATSTYQGSGTGWSGNKQPSGEEDAPVTLTDGATTTFRIVCKIPNSNHEPSATVHVTYRNPAPDLQIRLLGDVRCVGQECVADINWSSVNLQENSCVRTAGASGTGWDSGGQRQRCDGTIPNVIVPWVESGCTVYRVAGHTFNGTERIAELCLNQHSRSNNTVPIYRED